MNKIFAIVLCSLITVYCIGTVIGKSLDKLCEFFKSKKIFFLFFYKIIQENSFI